MIVSAMKRTFLERQERIYYTLPSPVGTDYADGKEDGSPAFPVQPYLRAAMTTNDASNSSDMIPVDDDF